jgi:hypothetical protein
MQLLYAVVESGWLECVLRRKASHLPLIHTNLGYGTVLTGACARQGCSATDDDDYYYI